MLSLMQARERCIIHICSKCTSPCKRCPWDIRSAINLVQSMEDEDERKYKEDQAKAEAVRKIIYNDPCPE